MIEYVHQVLIILLLLVPSEAEFGLIRKKQMLSF